MGMAVEERCLRLPGIEVERRATVRIAYSHTNVGPASEDLPLTNTDRDVELEASSPNRICYATMTLGPKPFR